MDFLHRTTVLMLLVGFQASYFEAVTAALSDGDVHHETMVESVEHAASFAPGHAEDGAESVGSHEHDSDHRHGTSADHCTHVHGTAVPGSAVFVVGSLPSTAPIQAVVTLEHYVPLPKTEPPRI